jgi:hypothetical protein
MRSRVSLQLVFAALAAIALSLGGHAAKPIRLAQSSDELMATGAVFVLVFSIATGGSAIEGRLEQNFATKKECLAGRERLLEAHRQSFPEDLAKMTNARCEQVERVRS